MAGSRRLWPLLLLMLVLGALALDFWHRSEPVGVDFHTYEAAARVGVQKGWSHIYDQALVAAEQKHLVPGLLDQPFLSPPPVAWLAAVLVSLPYTAAYYIWAVATVVALVLALAWSASSRGPSRWIAIVGVIAAWWVLHAVFLGQVVPLVAAGVLLGWRLIREERHLAAGIALGSLLLLKPNTATLVPFALLAAGRFRTFVACSFASAALIAMALLSLGSHGVSTYLSQLTGALPPGADALTLRGALGVSGPPALGLRLAIAGAALAIAYRLRRWPGVVLATGVLASLLVAPYLHASDLCLLAAAGWLVWEERPAPAWRLPLFAGWLLATPYAAISGLEPALSRWPLLELAALAALAVVAWRADQERSSTPTSSRRTPRLGATSSGGAATGPAGPPAAST